MVRREFQQRSSDDSAVLRAAAAVVSRPSWIDQARPTTSWRRRQQLTGDLDVGALAAALAGMWLGGMRCCGPCSSPYDGQPRQQILDRDAVHLDSPMAEVAEAELAAAVAEAAAQPFDLAAERAAAGTAAPHWPRRCMCWWWCCITSRGDGWLDGGAWPGPVGGVCGTLRAGRGAAVRCRCRCSTPITRCRQREVLGDEDDPGSLLAPAGGVLAAGACSRGAEELALPADRPRPADSESPRPRRAAGALPAEVHRGSRAGLARSHRSHVVRGGAGRAGDAGVGGWGGAGEDIPRIGTPMAGRTG